MGQKSNPIGLRLQINRTWDSRWYAEGAEYGRMLLEDIKIRKFIFETLPQAAISKVVIERPAKNCRVSIYAARPGVIIGKKGADIEKLKKQINKFTTAEVSLNIVEIRKPEVDAKLVAQGIADQLIRREALTAYGIIGIKCWIFKGEILGHDPMATDRLMMEAQTSGVRPQSDRR